MEARVDATPAALDKERTRAERDAEERSVAEQFAIDEEDLKPRPIRLPGRRPVLIALAVVAVLVLLAVLPPLVSMERYRKRIVQSISLSLGRPVRIDAVTLQVLPTPGFTLQTFVVGEDPAFGAEPVIRAQTVTVHLRVSSLWRRRLEFSSISLEDPSVNLVRRADGEWNFESILLQASRMPAAPTAQRGAGAAPRFPYIEARGARVNLKMDLRKLPVALTDSKFALWLPEPDQWHVRLQGHVARTDVAVNDTGLFHIEGTLGKATALPNVPVDVHADWTGAPLGGVSLVLLGRDMGVRGEMDLASTLHGTVGDNHVETRLAVHQLRRADFVPDQTLELSALCTAQARGVFARLEALRCASPADVAHPELELTGTVPNLAMMPSVGRPRRSVADRAPSRSPTGSARLRVADVPAASLLTILRVVSLRVSPDLKATGSLSGELQLGAEDAALGTAGQPAAGQPAAGTTASGAFHFGNANLALAEGKPLLDDARIEGTLAGSTLAIAPFPLDLGGADPATLSVTCTGMRCEMHLAGWALRSRLLALAAALPQFGDGLEAALPPVAELPPAPAGGADSGRLPESPMRVDLVATRELGEGQTWQPAPAIRIAAPARRHRHRR